MEDIKWHINADWQTLDPDVGDIILCHYSDGFDYSVKITVIEISDTEVKGLVEGVFDLHDKFTVIRNHSLEGQVLLLPRSLIQKVVKKLE